MLNLTYSKQLKDFAPADIYRPTKHTLQAAVNITQTVADDGGNSVVV